MSQVQDGMYLPPERSTATSKGRTSTHLRREIDDELDFYYSTAGINPGRTQKGYVFRNSYFDREDGYGRDERRMEKD
jgi:hypothetical protein